MIERFWGHPPRGVARSALPAGLVAAATPFVALLHLMLPESNLAVAYLPAVMLAAVLAGAAPALGAAALAFLAYDFLFVAPYFTLTVSDPQEWANLSVFLAVAVATGQLAGVARTRAVEATRNERDATTQFRLVRALTDNNVRDGMRAGAQILADETGTQAVAARLHHENEAGAGPSELLARMSHPDAVRDSIILGRPDDRRPTGRWVRPRRQILGRRPSGDSERFARVRITTGDKDGWIVLGPVHAGLSDANTQRLLVTAAALIGTAVRRDQLIHEANEAVSNGVPAFSPPEARHAQRVLILMGGFFVTIFLGMSFLAGRIGILPDPTEQTTVISQLTSALVGGDSPYHYLVQISTALLLILAANTAYSDFPRLSSILARDGYWPRQFQYRGDRLAFSTGIFVLTVLSAALLVVFSASVTDLIPLYTVGVFIAFTLSQSGMVRHWWKLKDTDAGWWRRAAVNAVGALATGIVAVVVGVAKFALGAWVVLILVPVIMALMMAIHRHYRGVQAALTVDAVPEFSRIEAPQVLVPVSRLDRAAYRAIRFAQSISPTVIAVHVSESAAEAGAMQQRWDSWGTDVELVIVESPYRSLLPPLLAYIDAIRAAEADRPVVVVVAEFVPRYFWQNFLHNQAALRLKMHLLSRPNVIVANVPSHLGETQVTAERAEAEAPSTDK